MSTIEGRNESGESRALRNILATATDVAMITREVSRSGMTHYVSVLAVRAGRLEDVTLPVGEAIGNPCEVRDEHDVLRVRGSAHTRQVYHAITERIGNVVGRQIREV